MADDVLTFEELRSVQNAERESDTLQDLDEAFFDRARNYLELKKEGDDHLQAQEYRNAKNILQDVLDMRQKKIVKLAFLSVKSGVTVENMLPHEEELFAEVEEAIGSYRHDRQAEVFGDGGTIDAAETAAGTAEEPDDGSEDESLPVADAEDEEEDGVEPPTEEETLAAEDDTEDVVEDRSDEDDGAAGADEEDGEEEVDESRDDSEESPEEQDDDADESSVEDILEFETAGDSSDEERDEDKPEEEDADDDTEDDDVIVGEPDEDAEDTVAVEEADDDSIVTESDSDAAAEEQDDTSGGDEAGDDRVTVEVQERVPEFMGTDLEAYGPFEEGEEVRVPPENAEVLEDQGKAERV